MTYYSIEPRTRKHVKGHWFSSFARNLSDKYKKKILDIATKTELDFAKTASKKVVHKTAEGRGELIGSKIAEKTVKPKPISDINFKILENNRLDTELAVPLKCFSFWRSLDLPLTMKQSLIWDGQENV